MILPVTAARTDGLCMPCVHQKRAREREQYIATHRRDVDRFVGVTDPVEMLEILHRPATRDPLVNLLPPPRSREDLYSGLDADQAERLAAHAIQYVRRGELDPAEDIATCLACFADADITTLLEALVTHGNLYPGQAFRGASAAIRDRLIARVGEDPSDLDHLLTCLAWIGDDVVVDLFARWRWSPPSWRSDLHVPPEEYALEAGWELTPADTRRNLFYDICHTLVPGSVPRNVVALASRTSEACAWCARPLVALLALDAPTFELVSSKASWRALEVPTCLACACYSVVYGYSDARRPVWHPANADGLPDSEGDSTRPAQGLVLSGTRRGPYHAASQFLPTRFSQLGGHPTWIQDAEYPPCPECSRRMMAVGQVSGGDVEGLAEGIYYAFACDQCPVSATSYQQT
jgi:hypothetical protein